LRLLTRVWADEFGRSRVRVNAVSAGPTETPAPRHAGLTDGLATTTALGRVAAPDDSPARNVLASPDASYINGAGPARHGGQLAIAVALGVVGAVARGDEVANIGRRELAGQPAQVCAPRVPTNGAQATAIGQLVRLARRGQSETRAGADRRELMRDESSSPPARADRRQFMAAQDRRQFVETGRMPAAESDHSTPAGVQLNAIRTHDLVGQVGCDQNAEILPGHQHRVELGTRQAFAHESDVRACHHAAPRLRRRGQIGAEPPVPQGISR